VIDGSSTVFPITEAASIAFRGYAPKVEIRLGVSGTGGGFKKFCAGETVISDASRPITQAEAEACAKAGVAYVELPIAFDGITVMVHPENTWATCITVAELKALWEPAAEKKVNRWSQVRAAWPDTPITLYGAGADSGTYDYFTQAIVGTAKESRKDYTASEDDYLLAQDLAADTSGLGFFGYAYYVEYKGQLHDVAIDNGSGCVAPSQETIADGRYQPLSRPIFLYVRADALERPELRAFLNFYLANGPALVREARYIPLPDRAYPLAARRIERRITGSVFSGSSQIGVSIEDLLLLEGGQ
jgi:phosphate transport system substrate-binding protein